MGLIWRNMSSNYKWIREGNMWFSLNKLPLNVTKTNSMVFGKENNNSSEIIKFNNHTIERVSTAKFLGVIVDEKLNWSFHVSHV